MAGKTDIFENDILKLIFNGVSIANIADNTSTSPLTTLYLSLHTADPGDGALSGQTTNETAYTGYARIGLARTSGGWTVTGGSVSPTANVEFGTCTAGSAVITHVGVGTSAAGTGKLLYSGALSPYITVVAGVIPRLTTASTITED